jgi:hypothetical protein
MGTARAAATPARAARQREPDGIKMPPRPPSSVLGMIENLVYLKPGSEGFALNLQALNESVGHQHRRCLAGVFYEGAKYAGVSIYDGRDARMPPTCVIPHRCRQIAAAVLGRLTPYRRHQATFPINNSGAQVKVNRN